MSVVLKLEDHEAMELAAILADHLLQVLETIEFADAKTKEEADREKVLLEKIIPMLEAV